jgi:RND family efflux transporter MFP subunit
MRLLKLVTAVAVSLASLAFVGCGPNESAPPATKPPGVVVAVPVTDYITDYEDFTGRTDAVFSIDVRARVTGYLDKVAFKDGDEVKEGDLLFEIDPRPYQAQLAATEASILQGVAHLKRLEADYQRVKNLFHRGNASREEFDKVAGDRGEAEAMVGLAKASYELAKLNVTFTKVIAPINGRLSRRMVDPGNLVKQDDTILTSIVSLDPMYVYFDVDERTLLKLRRLVREGRVKTRQEADVPVLVGLSDEEGYPHRALVNFSDNRIDANTGTLRVRGVIENPRITKTGNTRVFSPGLFARVRLPVGSPHKELLIPEEAIGTDQGRKYIYVVQQQKKKSPAAEKKDSAKGKAAGGGEGGVENIVVDRTVVVGASQNGLRVITDGLKGNEQVIVSGIQRVRPGSKVNPRFKDAAVQVPAGKAATAAR